MFDFKDVFNNGVELMDKFGMLDALNKAHEAMEEVTQKNLEQERNSERAEKAKYRFRYKGWD